VRALCLALAFALSAPLAAQDEPLKKKPAARKKQATATQGAHKKPSAEQLRKFKELEKKQQ
jgi:hypothetical protein